MSPKSEWWSLAEAARVLRQPQHRLIYLCEKGVIVPDFGDAHGRGSSRRFSERNLLEFAIALKLRDLEIPAVIIAAILYTLRAFEEILRDSTPDFQVLRSLQDAAAPDIRVIVADGDRLYFSLGDARGAKLFGGVPLRRLVLGTKPTVRSLRSMLKESSAKTRSGGLGPEGTRYARIELDITRVAKDLRLAT